MRILALAELARDWAGAVEQWRDMNEGLRSTTDAPSAAHEYMLYQTLIGVWPLEGSSQELTRRVCAYAIKAAREGKQQTSWINVDGGYERELETFVGAMLDPARSGPFLESFGRFAPRAALLGALNSLSQLGLKAMLPGVPDFYQGTELWDLSLVDPDNRRAVDFEARQRLVEHALEIPWPTLADAWPNGTIKFALTSRLLAIRAALRELFLEGDYEPLPVQGEDRAHVIAFARRHRGEAVIVMAGRHFSEPSNGGRAWPRGGFDARIVSQGGEFFDLLTPAAAAPVALDAKVLLDTLPVAVVSSRPL